MTRMGYEKMNDVTIGIDISKAFLDVATYPDGEILQFSNDKSGLKALVKCLKGRAVSLVVFEATGSYHKALETALDQAGVAFAKVNPLRARRFAQATGQLAKTDRADALSLARYAAVIRPSATRVKPQNLEVLHEMVMARLALKKESAATKTRLKTMKNSFLIKKFQGKLRLVEKDVADIDAECFKLVKEDHDLSRRFDILSSVPGLGQVSIMTMLTEMPELGSMDKRQAAALAGLAPITRQSGTWTGKSFTGGGRSILRKALYMPALVAARFNKYLKAKYDDLIRRGKPAKIALTAIMRNIIVIANALIRDNRLWNQNMV